MRAQASEKHALSELHESNIAYAECLKKYEALEGRTANLRAELVRITKERNEAEALASKYKLKSKVRAQKIKILEDQLGEKVKECDSRQRTCESLKRTNDELREENDKLSAKLRYFKNS